MSQLDIREPFQFFDWFGLSEAAETARSDLSYQKRFELFPGCEVKVQSVKVLPAEGARRVLPLLADRIRRAGKTAKTTRSKQR